MTAPEWRDDANCRDTDSEAFFPEGTGSTADRMVFEICERCPVRRECLDYAIEHHERDGVWGGMTPNDRRKYAKRSEGRAA